MRRAKPAAIRLVGGTFQESRHGTREDAAAQVKADKAERMPAPPRWLGSVARAEWKRIAPILHDRGLLARRHVASLAAYCRAYGEMVEAQREIESKGRFIQTQLGNWIQAPWVGAANKAADQLRGYLVEFGLSPSSEARFGSGGKVEADALEEFNRDRAERKAGRAPGAK